MTTAPKSTQEQLESQRSLNEPAFSPPHALIRHYYAKLCTTIDSSPICLKSLCREMYSIEMIDHGIMMNLVDSESRADTLLDYVQTKIEQSPETLQTVLCILEKEEILQRIVQDMRHHPLETNGIQLIIIRMCLESW